MDRSGGISLVIRRRPEEHVGAAHLHQKVLPKLEVTGSVPRLLIRTLSIYDIRRVGRTFRRPRLAMLYRFRIADVPKRLVVLHVVITGILLLIPSARWIAWLTAL